MTLNIKKYPDPVLRKKTEEIKDITPDIRILIKEMKEAVDKYGGVGLAAPQVGESKRIIIIKTEKNCQAFINPLIVGRSKKTDIMEEGCLSFPQFFLKIKRSKEIEIEAVGESGDKVKITAKDLMARILQHEIDHLDGILFIDRANIFQRIRAKIKFYIK